jgi:hypothetical protein
MLIRTKKKIFARNCEAKPSAAIAMSPKYCFRPRVIYYFLVDYNNTITRKYFYSVVKVTFDQ